MKRILRLGLVLAAIGMLVLITAGMEYQGVRYVTVGEIQRSLPCGPIVVGFDIDDTLLFSSPGFNYGLTNRDGPNGSNRYGAQPLGSQAFWDDMNGEFDSFSLPKRVGGMLLQMHASRGDHIICITARTHSDDAITGKLLAQYFGIEAPEICYTDGASKETEIRERGVFIYYGDADSDMLQAISGFARPIRVMRSTLSTNIASAYHPGICGEEVVWGSEE